MRILVTGGLGYVGGHLVEELAKKFSVTILDSMLNSKRWKWSNSVGIIQGSVCNKDAVFRAMKGASLVYHLANRTDYSPDSSFPIRLYNTNVIGTATVLAMAKKAGIDRVIFTSSHSVYGNIIDAQEGDVCLPVTIDGTSKLASESICRHFSNEGMTVPILRLFSVYGGENSSSVVDLFQSGGNIINGDGSQSRDFVHIDDVVKALIQAQFWDSGLYNICSGVETTISGLYALNSQKEPEYKRFEQAEQFRICGKNENTFRKTQFKPEIILF